MHTHRRWINILAIALLALSVLVIYIEKNDARETAKSQLLNSNLIKSIVINTGHNDTVLRKQDDDWYMHQPQQQKAERDRIGPLLSLLQLPQRQSYAAKDVNLAELGLEQPHAVITLNDIKFSFGDLTNSGDSRYVLVNDRVHLFSEMFYPLINAGPSALIQQPG